MAHQSALQSNRAAIVAPEIHGLRYEWIDIARGVGIFLVVFQHVVGGLIGSGFFKPTPGAEFGDYAITILHMPLFFLLAGLNVEHSIAKGKRRFLQSKIRTIVYPYFLWSVLQGGSQLLLSRYINSAPTAKELLHIFWAPIGQFWFLYVLMLCHLLALILPISSRLLFATLAAVAFGSFFLVPTFLLRQTLYMFLFYALGILFASQLKKFAITNYWIGNAGFFSLFLLFLAAAHLVYRRGIVPHDFPTAAVSLLGTMSIIWFAKFTRKSSVPWLVVLGQYSMSIYVMHVLAAAGMRVALKLAHIRQPLFSLGICVVSGLLLPILAQRILEQLRLAKLFGLSPVPQQHRSSPKSAEAIA